ncbi:hypothetical protein Adt_23645 [Abeliophyllum distichum]|uniref:UBN2 domain-containing protein n=1 Tax=Abeliophyllum distichum TaxID=126358 RepID=A0ABD1SBQ0_9LAMI
MDRDTYEVMRQRLEAAFDDHEYHLITKIDILWFVGRILWVDVGGGKIRPVWCVVIAHVTGCSDAPVTLCNSTASTISVNINSIPMLNGSNFKDWKENVLIVLSCMDLDLAIRIEKPASLTDASSPDDRRNFEKWERSNRMSLMIIKHGIPEAFRGAISEEVTNAKEFLAEIEKRFTKNDKAETSTLLQSLISMKYKSKGNIMEYIMQMSHTASKLKALKLDLSDDLIVHLVLISLPAHFSQFKVSYNCQKEK